MRYIYHGVLRKQSRAEFRNVKKDGLEYGRRHLDVSRSDAAYTETRVVTCNDSPLCASVSAKASKSRKHGITSG